MKTTVLLPGGFKPPHEGHIQLINRYAENPEVEKVVVMIGPKERDGITRDQSLRAMKLLLKNPKISVIPVASESPILAIYEYILGLPKDAVGSYAMGASSKGGDDKRLTDFAKDIEKYKTTPTRDGKTAPKGVSVNTSLRVNVDPLKYIGRNDEKNGQEISSTVARKDLLMGDRDNFATNYPSLDKSTADKLFDIFSTTIKEPEEKKPKSKKKKDDSVKESKHISDILEERAHNRLTLLTLLLEGGNAIPTSIEVDKDDVKQVVKSAIKALPSELRNQVQLDIGSSGYKIKSGDIDIFLDEDSVINYFKSKDSKEAKKALENYFLKQGFESKVTGRNVHIGIPYKDAKAQVDFMVIKDASTVAPWHQHGPRKSYEDPEFKGSDIFIIISSIAKYLGYKFDPFGANLIDRESGKVVARDRDKVAKMLLNPKATAEDLNSVKSILNALKNDPNKDEKLAQAKADEEKGLVKMTFKEGIIKEDEGPRIQHPEDLTYWEGSKGAKRALDTISKVAKDPSSISVKWDGSPAVVFGVDQNGNFILTDKSGFAAKGYDGKAKSSKELENMFNNRAVKAAEKKGTEPDYSFSKSMAGIFDSFKNAIPKGVKGYFKGDLLYRETPKIENGDYVFKPNVTTYRIPVNSELGKQIKNSKIGVVIHSFESLDGKSQNPKDFKFNPQSGVLVMPPTVIKSSPKVDSKKSSAISSMISSNANDIDSFLKADELKALKITNLPDLLYKFTNSKVSDFNSLNTKEFIKFIESDPTVSANKKTNITNYINQNKKGADAVFSIVKTISDLKNSIISQLDSQDTGVKSSIGDLKGGEGYVVSDPKGSIKLVNRAGFTAANRAVER